jgi:hypothetical protein
MAFLDLLRKAAALAGGLESARRAFGDWVTTAQNHRLAAGVSA